MRKIILAVSLIFTISTIGLGTMASGSTSVNVDFKPDEKLVTISGDGVGVLAVMVLPSGTESSALSDLALPTDLHQIMAEGEYTFSFYMPKSATYKKYQVRVTDVFGNTDYDSFIYYDKSSADSIVSGINSGNLAQTVGSKAAQLGIDTEDADYSADVLTLMSGLYTDYSDSTDFYNKYTFSKAVCAFKGKEQSGVEGTLRKYQEYLGIDYSSEYEKNPSLTSAAKSYLTNLLATSDYKALYSAAEEISGEEDFEAFYACLCAVSVFGSADSWKLIEENYLKEGSFLCENILKKNSDFSESISTDVFTAMKDMSFSKPSDLKDNFDIAVKNVLEGINNVSVPTPSGGKVTVSSGGGGGGALQYDTLPEKEEVSEGGENAVTVSLPALDSAASFSDVPSDAWFYSSVSALGGNNIISGDETGNFRPYDNITRAEFIKLIVSAFSINGGVDVTFSDVSDDAWYAPFVKRGAASGVISGYGGLFRPGEPILRQDAVLILYRLTDLFKIEYKGYSEPADMENATLYAWSAIGAFHSNKIVQGDAAGNFNPQNNISRAEAAQLLYNIIGDMSSKTE